MAGKVLLVWPEGDARGKLEEAIAIREETQGVRAGFGETGLGQYDAAIVGYRP